MYFTGWPNHFIILSGSVSVYSILSVSQSHSGEVTQATFQLAALQCGCNERDLCFIVY